MYRGLKSMFMRAFAVYRPVYSRCICATKNVCNMSVFVSE